MTRLLLITALLALSVAGAQAEDIQSLLARGHITVYMMEAELPPFIMTGPDGKPAGYDVEIAKGIASELGVELAIERKAKTFNELVDAVAEGKADIAISKLSRTLARSKKVIFSEPYLILHKALLVNRLEMARKRGERPVADYVKNLRGKIGVIKGSSYQEFAPVMFPKAEAKAYGSWNEIRRDVNSGELLCGFRDDLEVKRDMRSIPGAALNLTSVVFKDEEDPIAIAIDAKNIQLRFWIDEFLDDRKLRTTADKLLDKYPEAVKAAAPLATPPPPANANDKGAASK